MRNVITILFMLLVTCIYSQNKSISSENLDSIIQGKIEIKIKPYVENLDSVNDQIEKYKLNENYYTTALSSQTAIFSVIVTLLVLIIGFISYNKFKSEVKTVETKYQESIDNYNKINESLKETHCDLYTAIGILHQKEKLYGDSVKFFLRGIANMSMELEGKEAILENISALTEIITQNLQQSDIEVINEEKELIYKYLNQINTDDNEIHSELAKLRISLDEKMNNA